MAEQETREREDAASATEDDGSTGQDSGGQDAGSADADAGQESGAKTEQKSDEKSEQNSDEKSEQKSDEKSGQDSDEKSGQESDAKSDRKSGQESDEKSDEKSGQKTEQTPARRSENHAKPEQLSEEDRKAQERSRSTFGRGPDEAEDSGRSIDVSDLIWKGANVLATVVRAVTLLFAAILVIQIGLSIAAVNPANGFARFVRGFSDTVVLGFRDLFLPTDPTVMLIVNFGVAAVFWVLVGVFVSSALRWVAARIT